MAFLIIECRRAPTKNTNSVSSSITLLLFHPLPSNKPLVTHFITAPYMVMVSILPYRLKSGFRCSEVAIPFHSVIRNKGKNHTSHQRFQPTFSHNSIFIARRPLSLVLGCSKSKGWDKYHFTPSGRAGASVNFFIGEFFLSSARGNTNY